MSELLTFTRESEDERRTLFAKTRLSGKLMANQVRFLSKSGVLPVHFEDGTRVLYISDVHAPAHNRLAMWALFQFIRWYRPHTVVFIGDVNDMFSLSMWPASPRVPVNPQWELDETRKLIYKVLQLGVYWVVVIDGNHEDRLNRWVTKYCKQFSHLTDPTTREPALSIPRLMGFRHDDPITFITGADGKGGYEGGLWVNNHHKAEHGSYVQPTPGDSVRKHAETFHRDTVIGHTHRMGAFARRLNNDTLTGVELGCLIDWNHPFFNYHVQNDWHLGFGVGTVFGGKMHVQPVPIIEGLDDEGNPRFYFVYGNKVFSSSDR